MSELKSGHHQTPHLGSGLGRYIASAPADRGVFKRDAVLEVHTDCNEVFLRLMGNISWIVLSLLGLGAADGLNIGSIVLAVVGGLILLIGFRMVCKNA